MRVNHSTVIVPLCASAVPAALACRAPKVSSRRRRRRFGHRLDVPAEFVTFLAGLAARCGCVIAIAYRGSGCQGWSGEDHRIDLPRIGRAIELVGSAPVGSRRFACTAGNRCKAGGISTVGEISEECRGIFEHVPKVRPPRNWTPPCDILVEGAES